MAPKPFSLDSKDLLDDTMMSDNYAPAVVIVTPYSTGCCMALEIQKRGYKLICLWSAGFSDAMKKHVPVSCRGSLTYDLVLEEQPTLRDTAAMVRDQAQQNEFRIVACICGGEAGVDLADALSETLGLLTNGTDVPNRRDKKVQQELVKAAGMRSVRQAAGTSFEEVEEFLQTERYPLIVKPQDSAGSDGVKLCHSLEEAKEHFCNLTGGYELVNGGACTEVLCQEFLNGKEYVVDHVSRDGVHKTVMVWVYDKREVNGASFVYFGDIPVDSETPEAKLLIPYARSVLDAMGVKNGPSHCEIIITGDGSPCLVEMNCRANGGDGVWQPLCRALTGGYNQIDASADAYLDKDKFDLLPDKPPSPFLAFGQCVDLVSFSSGTVKSTPGYEVIKLLPSFVHLETHIKPGSKVVPTVDLVTDIGAAVVMHSSKEVLERDIALIRQMERSNLLFEYYPKEEKQPKTQRKKKQEQRSCSFDYSDSTTTYQFIPINRSRRRIVSMVEPNVYLY